MAVRRWQVHPDIQVNTHEFGPVFAVSREALIEAVMDGVSLLDRSGGVLTVLVGRHPTDLPAEMLTTGAVCEWKDRSDARPQQEQQISVVAAPPQPQPEPSYEAKAGTDPVLEATEAVVEVTGDGISDGLDPTTLEEEDVSSVPETLR